MVQDYSVILEESNTWKNNYNMGLLNLHLSRKYATEKQSKLQIKSLKNSLIYFKEGLPKYREAENEIFDDKMEQNFIKHIDSAKKTVRVAIDREINESLDAQIASILSKKSF